MRWFRRKPTDKDLEDEVHAHLEMRAREYQEQGLSEEEALAKARRRFGSVAGAMERAREVNSYPWLDSLRQDIGYALRGMQRNPGFTLTALLALTLGIGTSTAVFSVVDRLLFRSLPYPDDERLVSVGILTPLDSLELMMSGGYYQWKERQTAFDSLSSWSAATGRCDLTERDPVRLTCAPVEWDFLPTLGVRPMIGRNFAPEEDRRGVPPVALISHGLWQRRFGGDPNITGRTFSLNSQPTRIIGVLGPGFDFPVPRQTDVLIPQAAPQRAGTTRVLRVFGRLRPGVTLAEAEAQLRPLFEESLKEIPPAYQNEVSLQLRSLRDRRLRDSKLASWLLLASVLALLLIACVNVANLLLARAAVRRQEMTVRVALGAARGRLIRQALTEGFALACLGAVAGCAFARLLLGALTAIGDRGVLLPQEAGLDFRVLFFCVGVALACGVVFGLAPALRSPQPAVPASPRTVGAPRGGFRLGLVAVQIGAALVLLGVSGLLLKSFWNLLNEPLGMDTGGVVTAHVSLPGERYAESAHLFFSELEERLERLPGAQAGAISDSLPPSGAMRSRPFFTIQVFGQPPYEEGTGGMVGWRAVTPGYFEALGIPIVEGRGFQEQDRELGRSVTILSESLARRLFPAGNPLGRRLRLGMGDRPWYTVIGVAGDVKNAGLARQPDSEFYLVRQRSADYGLGNWAPPNALRRAVAIVRTSGRTDVIAELVRSQLAEMDPLLPFEVGTMDQRVDRLGERSRSRFYAITLIFFAGAALLLAAIGVYGVMSFLVAECVPEIAVRMAIGATPRDVAGLIFSRAAKWALPGILVGLAGSAAAGVLAKALLFRVSSTDPAILAASVSTLLVVMLLAAGIPSRRAASVDPMVSLRHE